MLGQGRADRFEPPNRFNPTQKQRRRSTLYVLGKTPVWLGEAGAASFLESRYNLPDEFFLVTIGDQRRVWRLDHDQVFDTSGDHQMGGVGLDHAVLRTDREVVTGNMVALGVTGN